MEKDFVTWFGDFFSLITDVLIVTMVLTLILGVILSLKKIKKVKIILPLFFFLIGPILYGIKLGHRAQLIDEYKRDWENQLTVEEKDHLDNLIYDYTLFSFYWAPEFRQKSKARHPGKYPH